MDGPGGDGPSGLNGAMIPWFATTSVPFEYPSAIGAIPPAENGEPATGVRAPVCAFDMEHGDRVRPLIDREQQRVVGAEQHLMITGSRPDRVGQGQDERRSRATSRIEVASATIGKPATVYGIAATAFLFGVGVLAST